MVDYTQIRPAFDRKAVFFDSSVLYNDQEKINIDSTESDKLVNNVNCFNNRVLKINLFAGVNSTFADNQIINSNTWYVKDKEIFSKTMIPFDDSESYLGRDLTLSMNPIKKVVTYGLENPDTVFEDLSNEPFEEAPSLENISEYFEIPSKLKYPRFYNTYAISRLNSTISVFGTLESIDGNLLTLKPLQGISVEIIKNGKDSRNRSVNISSKTSIKENNAKNKNRIESFLDDVIEDLPTNDQGLVTANYNYNLSIVNGRTRVTFTTGQSQSKSISRLTNAAYYYTEDDLNIIPFDDTRKNRTNKEYSDDDIFSPTGYTTNNINGGLPQSIAYVGDID